eukprot:TRINITY_DN3940_c0_g1_i1.p1 TRINITY_DN3940_c0_g1~~TRINITY_DN3940_c0_g1_i1.p1  ORF type:complete len:326 (+),score=113.72 TRINITY_DN3940_c0_g1_i1:93-980(+)
MCIRDSLYLFFFSSRRRHTRSCLVSWARRCVQETACTFFFFQAEDGIRDHAQSRGLGDVYKRQIYNDDILFYLQKFTSLDDEGQKTNLFDIFTLLDNNCKTNHTDRKDLNPVMNLLFPLILEYSLCDTYIAQGINVLVVAIQKLIEVQPNSALTRKVSTAGWSALSILAKRAYTKTCQKNADAIPRTPIRENVLNALKDEIKYRYTQQADCVIGKLEQVGLHAEDVIKNLFLATSGYTSDNYDFFANWAFEVKRICFCGDKTAVKSQLKDQSFVLVAFTSKMKFQFDALTLNANL